MAAFTRPFLKKTICFPDFLKQAFSHSSETKFAFSCYSNFYFQSSPVEIFIRTFQRTSCRWEEKEDTEVNCLRWQSKPGSELKSGLLTPGKFLIQWTQICVTTVEEDDSFFIRQFKKNNCSIQYYIAKECIFKTEPRLLIPCFQPTGFWCLMKTPFVISLTGKAIKPF